MDATNNRFYRQTFKMRLHDAFMRQVISLSVWLAGKGLHRVIYDRILSDPYLLRFYLVKREWVLGVFTAVLHRFMRSDSPEDGLHDHPFDFVSIILSGGYTEHSESGKKWYGPGSVLFRRAGRLHRIELVGNEPVWTLVIFGPRRRSWGFKVDGVWYPWKQWIKIRSGREVEET